MIRKINLIVGALLLLSITLYVVVLNRGTVAMYYSWTSSVELSLGVLIIVVFIAGFLASSLVALFYGFRAYLRERSYESKMRQQAAFFHQVAEARALSAAGEPQRARSAWEQLIRRDPTRVIARLEVSKLLESEGDLEEASRLVDEIRHDVPDNIEVMFRAAELYRRRGNSTAALDNVSLICSKSPNRHALELARDCALDLGRFDEAISYQQSLETLLGHSESLRSARAAIELKFVLHQSSGNPSDLQQKLEAHLKRYQTDTAARLELARVLSEHRDLEAASLQFIQLGQQTGDISYYERALALYRSNPERTLAIARSAVREANAQSKLAARLLLLRVYLSLGMLSEARSLLGAIDAEGVLTSQQTDPSLRSTATTLRAALLLRDGQVSSASSMLLDPDSNVITAGSHPAHATSNGPAPYLSTP